MRFVSPQSRYLQCNMHGHHRKVKGDPGTGGPGFETVSDFFFFLKFECNKLNIRVHGDETLTLDLFKGKFSLIST